MQKVTTRNTNQTNENEASCKTLSKHLNQSINQRVNLYMLATLQQSCWRHLLWLHTHQKSHLKAANSHYPSAQTHTTQFNITLMNRNCKDCWAKYMYVDTTTVSCHSLTTWQQSRTSSNHQDVILVLDQTPSLLS